MDDNKAFAPNLTLHDVWVLTKNFSLALLICALVFVVPYLLLRGTLFPASNLVREETSRWLGWGVIGFCLILIVFNLSDMLQRFSDFFGECARRTKRFTRIQSIMVVGLFILYVLGCQRYPEFTFFLSVLVLIPAGFAYDRYRQILRDKHKVLPAEPC